MKRLLAASTMLLVSTMVFADDGTGPQAACKDDVAKLCPDVQPGGGRIIACLKEHKDQVSDTCKASLKKMRARRAASGDGGGSDNPSGN